MRVICQCLQPDKLPPEAHKLLINLCPIRNDHRPHREHALVRHRQGSAASCGDRTGYGAGRHRQQVPQACTFRDGICRLATLTYSYL